VRTCTATIVLALAICMVPSSALAQRSGSSRGGGAQNRPSEPASNVQAPSGPVQPGTPGSAYRTSSLRVPAGGRGVIRRGAPYLWWWGWNVDYLEPPDVREEIAPAEPKRIEPPAESSLIQPLLTLPRPQPSQSARGKLQLVVEPMTAQVIVDGFYAGTVEDIAQLATGLDLDAGWHRLEFRAPGYVTPTVNVTIEANRTLTYRAELRPIAR
jgi:hypothetical protein